MRDNSGTTPSSLFQQLGANWQQRPVLPALVFRRDVLSCTQIALHDGNNYLDFPVRGTIGQKLGASCSTDKPESI